MSDKSPKTPADFVAPHLRRRGDDWRKFLKTWDNPRHVQALLWMFEIGIPENKSDAGTELTDGTGPTDSPQVSAELIEGTGTWSEARALAADIALSMLGIVDDVGLARSSERILVVPEKTGRRFAYLHLAPGVIRAKKLQPVERLTRSAYQSAIKPPLNAKIGKLAALHRAAARGL